MPASAAAHPDAGPLQPAAVPAGPPRLRPTTPRWLGPFFSFAAACPPAARALRPLVCAAAPVVAPRVRRAIHSNSDRIFAAPLSPTQRRRFVRRVLAAFYDFVADTARASRMSADDINAMIDSVEGQEAYKAARATKKGAILVTAHLGSFEAGLAALTRAEPRVRVVFQRDAATGFEKLRARLHRTIGVIETPIDDGMRAWLALRDALLADEVIVMQGDRAVPGQKSQAVPFLHGRLRIPTGPVRLAELTGAPIVPVFAIPTGRGRRRILLMPPIHASSAPSAPGSCDAQALHALAASLADVVRRHPHLWLALEPVFVESGAGHGA